MNTGFLNPTFSPCFPAEGSPLALATRFDTPASAVLAGPLAAPELSPSVPSELEPAVDNGGSPAPTLNASSSFPALSPGFTLGPSLLFPWLPSFCSPSIFQTLFNNRGEI
uniref:Uncharacterized protein n=1 Tax=uncultured eukaryote TaxID=100272 RepID=A8DR79_9EUKA|nr:hypothetical protein [uncultured eukaryote]